jgi:soluble lytic murein transglycosylase-like protein
MIRFKLSIAVFAILGMIGVLESAISLPGNTPSTSQFAKPLTPEEMDATREQEFLQEQYASAEREVDQIFRAYGCSSRYAATVGKAAVDNHLPARVVGSLVYVESSCNPEAISPRGAVGLMQINQRVWHLSRRELQDPETNVRIGTAIFHRYVKESGLREGLHRYNGLGDPSDDYSNRVLELAYAVRR